MPRHIIAKDENENVLGVVPLYLKRFSICSIVQTSSPHVAFPESLNAFCLKFKCPLLDVHWFSFLIFLSV